MKNIQLFHGRYDKLAECKGDKGQFKPSIARKRMQRFTKSVQAVKKVAHNDSNIVHGVWDKGICLLNKKAKLIS